MALIIDGKQIASRLNDDSKKSVESFRAQGYPAPALAVILVGDNPASRVYVSHKTKLCKQVGIRSETFTFPGTVSEARVRQLIGELNSDPSIDGILVQLPLPVHFDSQATINCVVPDKDVDGLSFSNQGWFSLNQPSLIPCTPLGVLELIRSTGQDLEGKLAAVVGRSVLVGSPTARLLSRANATVVTLHSRSQNPQEIASKADILVVAAGFCGLVNASWVKKGAVVIDVGIHRVDNKLYGDVDFQSVESIAGYITPVPGGVGPTTVAFLIKNCLKAYQTHCKHPTS